jgi:hypothetical protein
VLAGAAGRCGHRHPSKTPERYGRTYIRTSSDINVTGQPDMGHWRTPQERYTMVITLEHNLMMCRWEGTRGVGQWKLVKTIEVIALEAFRLCDGGSWIVSVTGRGELD